MGLIRMGGNAIASGVKKAGSFIANHGGRTIWNKVSPVLNTAGKLFAEDVGDIYGGIKWAGQKAYGAAKAVGNGALKAADAANDFDNNYLGGMGKKAIAHGAKVAAYTAMKKVNPDWDDKTIKGYLDPTFDSVNNYINEKVKKRVQANGMPNVSKGNNGGHGLGVSFQYINPYSNEAHSNISHW